MSLQVNILYTPPVRQELFKGSTKVLVAQYDQKGNLIILHRSFNFLSKVIMLTGRVELLERI